MSDDIDELKAQIEELKALIGSNRADQPENKLNSSAPPPAKHQVVSFIADGSFNLGEFNAWASSYGLIASVMPLYHDISSSADDLRARLGDMADILHEKTFAKGRVEALDRHQSDKQAVIKAAGGGNGQEI